MGEAWSGGRSAVLPPTRPQLLQRPPSWRQLLPLIRLFPSAHLEDAEAVRTPVQEWEGSTLPGQGLHGSRYTRSISTLTWWSVFSLQESPLLRHPWYTYVVPCPPLQRQHCSPPPHWLHHLHISTHARSCSPPPKASRASLPLLHIHSPPILPSVLTSRVLPEASPAPLLFVCML